MSSFRKTGMSLKLIALIYCRVSTVRQVERGTSLVSQEQVCCSKAEHDGFRVVDEAMFIERGESAKTTDRTQLQAMMKYATEHAKEIGIMYYYAIDRFSRDSGDFHMLRAYFKRLGIRCVSVTQPTDDTPAGRLVENMFSNIAQFDNEQRADRSRNGMIEAVKEGRFVWKAPTGFVNAMVNGKKNIVSEEPLAGFIARGYFLVSNGYMPIEALRTLERDGFRKKNGGKVSVTLWSKILHNPLYAGRIKAFGKIQQGCFKPIIEADLFDRVQAVLDGRNHKQPKYLMQREDFPLRGFLVHSCGKRYLGSWSKGRTKRYAHYHCRSCKKTNISQETVHAEFDGFISQHALKPELATLLKIAIEANMSSAAEDTERKRNELSHRIRELQGDQEVIMEKNIKGVVDDDTARRMIGEKKKAITECGHELALLPTASQRVSEVVDFGLQKLQDPRTAWHGFSLAQKQRFQTLLFPEGVTFDQGKCRTAKTALILQLKTSLHEGEMSLVTSPGVEPGLQA